MAPQDNPGMLLDTENKLVSVLYDNLSHFIPDMFVISE